MSKKSRPHEEAMIEMFQRDPRTFVSYVWETLHEQDNRIDELEKQCAVLKEIINQQQQRNTTPSRPMWVVPDHMVVTGSPANPWMNQKWSSGATHQMFGMEEKKP